MSSYPPPTINTVFNVADYPDAENGNISLAPPYVHSGVAVYKSDGSLHTSTNLVFKDSKNLGIGTSTPTAKLHVVQETTTESFRIDDVLNDTTPFIVDASGNVGINQASPKCPLHIGITQMLNIQPSYPVSGSYWYKLTDVNYTLASLNCEFRMNGLLAGPSLTTGKAIVDVTFSCRGTVLDAPRVTGIINGTIGTLSDIEIYKDTATTTYTVYLRMNQFAAVNINLQRTGGNGVFLYDGTFVTSSPVTGTNTLVYNLKDGDKSTPVFAGGILRNCDGIIGIGTSIPNTSAILDVTSTTKGMLPPRMTTTQRDAISTPAEGLIIYDSTKKNISYRDNTQWNYVKPRVGGVCYDWSGGSNNKTMSLLATEYVRIEFNNTLIQTGSVDWNANGTYVAINYSGNSSTSLATHNISLSFYVNTASVTYNFVVYKNPTFDTANANKVTSGTIITSSRQTFTCTTASAITNLNIGFSDAPTLNDVYYLCVLSIGTTGPIFTGTSFSWVSTAY